jgi:FAD/FMN-containing dehydrogenase
MKTIAPMQAERLFTPFLDAVDGTLCLPASATFADIHAQATAHSLRFPLIFDPCATLREQVAVATHAPPSFRFGPYCDNILGINWRLPGGRIARIGERVVKTTTGYDWLRFLLHSGSRFGEPIDYVLRLRPDCGSNLHARFYGEVTALRDCVRRLLHSGWMHWWDAVDFITEGSATSVRVAIHCPHKEARIFESQLTCIATEVNVRITVQHDAPKSFDGLPDMYVKTTPDRAIGLACELARDAERCVVLCYNGVVHVYLNKGEDMAERAHALIQPHIGELHALGGDWHSRWLPAMPPTVTESQWIETLEQSIHAS